MRTLALVAVLMVATACASGKPDTTASSPRSERLKCLHDHGVDTSGMKQYPNGIWSLPATGPEAQAAMLACVPYAPVTMEPGR